MERKTYSGLQQQKSCFNRLSRLVSVALQNARESEGALAMRAGRKDKGNMRQRTEWICQSQTCTDMDVCVCLCKINGVTGVAYMLEALCVNSWLAQSAAS